MGKICVIGGANIDICGASNEPLKAYDSNPGTIDIRYGGVGRNIAETLTKMGQTVEFVTCFADDHFGNALRQDCERIGINCSKSKTVKDCPSSIYLAVLDEKHDMHVAINDMRILDTLTKDDLDKATRDLKEDDLLVLDANLNESILEYICKHVHCLKAADPVSASKAMRLKPILKYLDIFKPNKYEAMEFTGIQICDEKSASACLDWFLNQGVKEILISMADQGVLLGTKEEKVWYTHRKIELDNATGGGDAFMGAYLSKRLEKASPAESVIFAISSAVLTIESNFEDRKKLTSSTIQNAIKEMEIKEKKL